MDFAPPPTGAAPAPAGGPARTRARLAVLAATAALVLAGCGDCCYDDYYDTGYVYVWNRTDTTTVEDVVAFRVAADGAALGVNLLPGPILPADSDFVVELYNGIYDGEAELSLGGFVDFFNFFSGDGADTILEVL